MNQPEPMNLMDPQIDPYNQAQQLRHQVQELEDEIMQLTHARDDLLQSGNKLAAKLQEITDSYGILDEWAALQQRYG